MRSRASKFISWLFLGFLLYCVTVSAISFSSQNDGDGWKVGYADMSVQECGCSKCHTVELEGCNGCHNSKQVKNDSEDSTKEGNNSGEIGNDIESNDGDSDELNSYSKNSNTNIEPNKPNSITPRKTNQNEKMK